MTSANPNPMNEPDIHYVDLTNGETYCYDRVIVCENGWLSCYLRTDSGQKRNIKFPPHMVEQTYADHEYTGPETQTLETKLGAEQ